MLLALVADIDPATPVLFVQTGQHFAETLAYRHDLTAALGLTDVRDTGPKAAERAANDPGDELWRYDPDACCRFRKVTPLERALVPFSAWVTGRKRHQALTRVALPLVERVDGKTKINPLADWTADQVEVEMVRRALPPPQPQPGGVFLDRLRALHACRRQRRGPAQRPLGRYWQDRVRHPSAA